MGLVSPRAVVHSRSLLPEYKAMRIRGTRLCALLALPLLQAAPAAADGPYVTVTASGTWQDNVTNATAGDGVLGAFMLGGGAEVSWLRAVDFSTILSAGLAATGDVCTSYSGLDSFGAGPRVELRHKLGLGPYAPSLSLGLEADATAFNDHARSNVDAAVTAGYSQRFSENLQLVLEAREGGYDASHSVYSGSYTSLRSEERR